MYCPKCRTELPDNAIYCIKCGYDFSKIKTPPARKAFSDPIDDADTILGQEIETSSFEKGTLFANRYEILDDGKKGGMGAVYKCKDTKLNKIVALKIIHPKLLSSQQALSRFRQEVAISQELQHPNIVKVFNLEEWESKEYFTMEWVEGVTLREIISRRKAENRPFSIDEAYRIISQLCDALQYAHNRTVHRDIKPENVMVTNPQADHNAPAFRPGGSPEAIGTPSYLKRGKGELGAPPLMGADNPTLAKGGEGGFVIKLTDFGIAKMLSPSQFTSTSMKMGTPYYMAPEQQEDAAQVDKRADIYALGVVLFELLILSNTIGLKLPSQINPSIPKGIDDLLVKALEEKPEDRYVDAKELSEALKKVADRFSEQAEINRKEAEEQRKKEEEKLRKEAEERKQKEVDQRKEQEEKQGRAKEKEEAEQNKSEDQKRSEKEQKQQTVETERIRIAEKSEQRKSFPFANKAIAAIVVLVIISGAYFYRSNFIRSQGPSNGSDIQLPETTQVPMNFALRFVLYDLTFHDKEKGLIWTRDGNIAGSSFNWANAQNFIKKMNDDKYAGYSNWRLPEYEELLSILDYPQSYGIKADYQDFLNRRGFRNIERATYWSCTTYTSRPTDAFYVDMYSGHPYPGNKEQANVVWPVRSAQISAP